MLCARPLLLAACCASTAPALAFDASGPVLPPTDGASDDPITGLSGRPVGEGRGTVGFRFGFALDPVIRWERRPGEEAERLAVLGRVYGVQIGALAGLSDRVALGLTAPVFFATTGDVIGGVEPPGGPALGDVHLWAPVTLAGRPDSAGALALVPWLALPTGAAARLLGEGHLGGGATVATSLRYGALSTFANLGIELRPVSTYEHARRASALRGSAGVGLTLDEGVVARAEVVFRGDLGASSVPWRPDETRLAGLPAEALLGLRGRVADRLILTAGGGVALTSGVGAARGRLMLGAAVPWGRSPEAVSEAGVGADGQRMPQPLEPVRLQVRLADITGQPLVGEAVLLGPGEERRLSVGDDGLAEARILPGDWRLRVEVPGYGPQEREIQVAPGQGGLSAELLLSKIEGTGQLSVRVLDPDGTPIDGAALTLDGLPLGSTSTGGTARVEGLGAPAARLYIAAPLYRPSAIDEVALQSEETLEVVLAPEPGSVQVRVSSAGVPVDDATAQWLGPTRLTSSVGPQGRRAFVLRPGLWTLVISSPRYGMQQRTVEIPPDAVDRLVVDVVLQPPEGGEAVLDVRVVDAQGAPIDGAELLLDGRSLGRTSTGGELRIVDLRSGLRALAVRGELLRPVSDEVVLGRGRTERTVVAQYVPGATRVIARSPAAAVTDALARFSGAWAVEPVSLGRSGRAQLQLGAGPWGVVVSSPTHGLQQRSLTVDEDSVRLHLVDVVFSPARGDGTLDLRVRDPRDRPVSGASVRLDEVPLGATGTGGDLHAEGLASGIRALRIGALLLTPHQERVRLTAGAVERTVHLDWAEGVVHVVVRDAHGEPVPDALVRFAGSRFVDPIPVDAQGAAYAQLDPGAWTVVASSPSLGLAQRSVTVPSGAGLTELDFAWAEPAVAQARLLVRVEDADGQPVPQARVRLGDDDREIALGSTALFEVAPGSYALRVDAEGYRPVATASLSLDAGDVERVIPLAFKPVPIRIAVRDEAGEPVAATVRFGGPAAVPALRLDATGRGEIGLRPGAWDVIAEARDLGAARASLSLVPGQPQALVALTLRPRAVDRVDGALRVREVVSFDVDSARVGPSASPLLDEVASTLLAHPEIRSLRVEGHTDDSGVVAYNIDLSQRRADAVRDALVARGVAPERLLARGYGPTRPLRIGSSERARAMNRRVAFAVVEISQSGQTP